MWLSAAHDARDFPSVDVAGTRQRAAESLGVVEQRPLSDGRSSLDDFRSVVHTNVGCSASVGIVFCHQVARVFFRPHRWTWQFGRYHQFRWSRRHITHGTRNVVVLQGFRVSFGERVIWIHLVLCSGQIATWLETCHRLPPFRISGQTQVVRTTAG